MSSGTLNLLSNSVISGNTVQGQAGANGQKGGNGDAGTRRLMERARSGTMTRATAGRAAAGAAAYRRRPLPGRRHAELPEWHLGHHRQQHFGTGSGRGGSGGNSSSDDGCEASSGATGATGTTAQASRITTMPAGRPPSRRTPRSRRNRSRADSIRQRARSPSRPWGARPSRHRRPATGVFPASPSIPCERRHAHRHGDHRQPGPLPVRHRLLGDGLHSVPKLPTFLVAAKGTAIGDGTTSAIDPTTRKSDTVQFLAGTPVAANLSFALAPIEATLDELRNSVGLKGPGDGPRLLEHPDSPEKIHRRVHRHVL